MILFDTNLISEAVRSICDRRVMAWLTTLPADEICTSAINVAELRAGIAVLPAGKRKSRLSDGLEKYVLQAFGERILPFDAECTRAFATIAGAMRAKGRAIGFADCQIAAIALQNKCTMATRDAQPFLEAGVPVINPWAE